MNSTTGICVDARLAYERLFNRVKDNLTFAKWLGDYVPR
jgi:hypothetical protein